MASYSVAEAKDRFSALINEAMDGDTVIITKHGREVVEMRAVACREPKPMDKAIIDWIRAQTADFPVSEEDGGTLVRRMRDEGY